VSVAYGFFIWLAQEDKITPANSTDITCKTFRYFTTNEAIGSEMDGSFLLRVIDGFLYGVLEYVPGTDRLSAAGDGSVREATAQ
jgi:hypothetical protein